MLIGVCSLCPHANANANASAIGMILSLSSRWRFIEYHRRHQEQKSKARSIAAIPAADYQDLYPISCSRSNRPSSQA